jgi:TetR/AcrR family transcriptional repressor of mexCD-oprJ operon
MARGEQMRAQVTAAILDAAAGVIKEHGDATSMADVAIAAGVGRATLYRYFESREALLRALSKAAIDDAESRLIQADLDQIPVRQALERATRALLAAGVKFSVITEDRRYLDSDEVRVRIGTRVIAVFQRGVDDGTFRHDVSVEVLARLWGGMLELTLRSFDGPDHFVEGAAAALVSVFFDGAMSR